MSCVSDHTTSTVTDTLLYKYYTTVDVLARVVGIDVEGTLGKGSYRSEPEKNDHDSLTLKVKVGIGPPLPGSGSGGGLSWSAARRAPGWSLPDPVTGSNGAPACMLIGKNREKDDHHQRRRTRTEHL